MATEIPTYSIIIPTFNHLYDCLAPCVNSVLDYTDIRHVEIIIVANGCTDGTVEWVRNFQKNFEYGNNIKLYVTAEQLGYTKATNIGLRLARGEKIVFLNNDTILLDQRLNHWLELLEEPFKDENVAITGPLSLLADGSQFRFIVFFVAMINRNAFELLGLLDERFSPGGCEDIEYAMRATAQHQLKIAVAGDVHPDDPDGVHTGTFPIYHKNNTTFGEDSEYKAIFARNLETLYNMYPQYAP